MARINSCPYCRYVWTGPSDPECPNCGYDLTPPPTEIGYVSNPAQDLVKRAFRYLTEPQEKELIEAARPDGFEPSED